jgi:hypothetical protein
MGLMLSKFLVTGPKITDIYISKLGSSGTDNYIILIKSLIYGSVYCVKRTFTMMVPEFLNTKNVIS